MADTFTYASLPSYGSTTSSYLTDLQKNRMGYYTGEKQKLEYDLNKLYTNKYKNLFLMKSADLQNIQQLNQQKEQMNQQIKQGFVTTMGGHKKGSRWQDPTKNAWYNPKPGAVPISETLTASVETSGPSVASGGAPTGSAGASMVDPGAANPTTVANPDYTNMVNFQNWNSKLAQSGFGQAGATFAGTPASVLGLAGTATKIWGGDDDPGTYTGTERFGDALSWGATAAKVAGMINPVLSIPAFLIAGYFGSKSGEKSMEEYNTAKKKWEDEQVDFMADWRRSQRDISKIGGTSPISMNWWNTTYS